MRRVQTGSFLLLSLLLALPAFSQSSFQMPGAIQPPNIELQVVFEKSAGESVRGLATVTIPHEWHINSYKPESDFLIPTVLTIESPVLQEVKVDYPPHVKRKFQFSEESLAVYEGTFTIPFAAKKTGADGDVTATLSYQACNNEVCLRPTEIVTATTLAKATVEKLPEIATTATPAAAPGPSAFTPLSEAPAGSGMFGNIGGTLKSKGLALTLLIVFLGGLALTLTPCVYPLIPLTMAFFSSQTGSRGRRTALAVLYVLGIALTYSALGVFSALSGALFGAWLQQPLVLGFFALLMLVLAASMFGLYDIRIPHFISDRAGTRAGLAGSFTMGLIAGVVAAPCVGPFVVSLIALVSQTADPYLGFLLFFTLALGLGLPFLLLGIFSSAVTALPRSGAWMVRIKQAMGFVLVAMMFYFLRPLVGEQVFKYGVAASLLAGAVFLLFRKEPVRNANIIKYVCAALLVIGAIPFLLPEYRGPHVVWDKYDEKALAAASAAGKPVMIDFYADWCMPCKELDRHTFTDKAVVDESERFVRLKADLTRPKDPRTIELSKKYQIIGVPTIVFIDSKGQEVAPQRLSGFEKPERFVQRLRGTR